MILVDPKELRRVSKEVEVISNEILQAVEVLSQVVEKLLCDTPFWSLSANQLGILYQIIVFDAIDGVMVHMINPEIVWHSDKVIRYAETCPSVPNRVAAIDRWAAIRIKYLVNTGEHHYISAIGALSRQLQHEIDHLHGILFIDRIGDRLGNI